MDALGFDAIARGFGDEGRRTMRMMVLSMTGRGGVLRHPRGTMTDDDLSAIYRLSDMDTMSVSAGIYSATAERLGWRMDLRTESRRLSVILHTCEGPETRILTVGCLCDVSGTPVACMALDRMPPMIASELAGSVGRVLARDNYRSPGTFEGLGTPDRPLELDGWLAGEDLLQPVLSAFCIQQILARTRVRPRSSERDHRSGRAPAPRWTCPSA